MAKLVLNFIDLVPEKVDTITGLFGEAQQSLFNPEEPSHHAWAKEMALRFVQRGTTFWISLSDDQIVGMVGLLVDKQPNGRWREFGEITHIAVGLEQRRQGHGSSLLRHVESVAPSRSVKILEVSTTLGLMGFYQKTVTPSMPGENIAGGFIYTKISGKWANHFRFNQCPFLPFFIFHFGIESFVEMAKARL